LSAVAAAAGQSLALVIANCVRVGMPPTLGKVPLVFHDKLLPLNKLDDRLLLDIVEGRTAVSLPHSSQYRQADFETLYRTYALALLKWRGHPIPEAYQVIVAGGGA
jgi:hypothetical protein